ncbi:MAG: cysteine desulfurase family protein [Candidatus Dadabacteria bacterium]|nr:cysteine desulfurase family protein [Candidatus Dadabacteria bacterium]MDE0663060.1 cysteine desulfurase family protein [Candidatus Dadabacteria bacterium]
MIFLDYQSTSPLDPRVVEKMQPYMTRWFGNPHSEHIFGWKSAEAIDKAQELIASIIGAEPSEILFTSGATESNNLAIQGLLRNNKSRSKHLVISSIEHKCVLNTARAMRKYGCLVDVVPVEKNGIVDIKKIESTLTKDTVIVSVMLVNNEIGTIQPIREIGELCNKKGIAFHVDAAQAVGKVPINVKEMKIDLLSISGHKVYGPKGIGALYVSHHYSSKIEPIIFGGAQQNNLRAGTVPAFLCAGLGEACRIADEEIEKDRTHNLLLRNALIDKLRTHFPGLVINGDLNQRIPGNLNIQLPGVDSDALVTMLQDKVAFSTGAACNAGIVEPSYVLAALGLSIDEINCSIRLGFGRFTSLEEVNRAIDLISEKAIQIRNCAISSNS